MLRKYTQIHWGKTLLMLLPPLLRKKKQAVWLKALTKPLESLYDDTLYKMQHNGQVMYLEKVLNELFNPGVAYKYSASITDKMELGYIVIEDAHRPRLQYLYTHKEIIEKRGESIDVTNNGESLEYQLKSRNFLYLSGASDFNSTEFFSFRILIPSYLLISTQKCQTVLACLQGKLDKGIIGKKEVAEQAQELNDLLVIADKEKSHSTHPDAVEIVTSKFHKVLGYYKLAGKSYETRKYDFSEKRELNSLRKSQQENKFLKRYMYIDNE